MDLGDYATPGTIIYRARIHFRDKVTSPRTDGNVWKDADLLEVANEAQRMIVSLLQATQYADSLGEIYREIIKNAAAGNQDFTFTTLGITAEMVTGVKVKYTSAGSYYIAKPLTLEDAKSLDSFQSSKTSPRYSIISLDGDNGWERHLRITPAFDATASSGLVVWHVEQPQDFVNNASKPSIPGPLHHLIPLAMGYLGWDDLGEAGQAEKFKGKLIEQLIARFKGMEDIIALRKIATREKP